MSSFVVFAVANSGEFLVAVPAVVGLLPRVRPHVHQQVTLLRKLLPAIALPTHKQVLTGMGRLDM